MLLRYRVATVALTALGLVYSAGAASADTLTANLPTNTTSCSFGDPSGTCVLAVSGNLADGAGTFSMQFTGDLNIDFSDPSQFCFQALDGTTNLITLTYPAPLGIGDPSTLELQLGTLCVTANPDPLEKGTFGGPFRIVGGTGVYSGATGDGSYGGLFQGSIDFDLDLTTFSTTDLTVPPPDNGGGGGPSTGATPELDSISLFGSGVASVAGYVLLRRRAARRRPG